MPVLFHEMTRPQMFVGVDELLSNALLTVSLCSIVSVYEILDSNQHYLSTILLTPPVNQVPIWLTRR